VGVTAVDYAAHSAYSDPGRWGRLLDEAPTDVAALSELARNVIAHYRAQAGELPESTRHEVDLRWLEDILAADQSRNPASLAAERPIERRVQGCCRDHTLFCVGVLRHHGIPARSRVGFASYFREGWNHDHVIVEVERDGRWTRFDPELEPAGFPFDPHDMDAGPDAPFRTAAEVWQGHRAGRLDVETFGVDPDLPIRGEWFVRSYVLSQLAHRYKDEVLLWDGWGVMGPEAEEGTNELADEIAALLVAADAGDEAAEAKLLERYRADDRLHPGDTIESFSPVRGGPVEVVLAR
jgi:Transglutaminase-like superfamily